MKRFWLFSVLLGMSLWVGGLTLYATPTVAGPAPDWLYNECVQSDRSDMRAARDSCDNYATGLENKDYNVGIFKPCFERDEGTTVRLGMTVITLLIVL